MNTAGAAGVHHKSYVPILHSFYTHIHKNLTFNNCISCCSAKSLHSTPLSVADTPLQGSLHVPSVMRTQPHSNHSKVMSVTTNDTHTDTFTTQIINPLQNAVHLKTHSRRQQTGSSSINLTLRCVHVTTVAVEKQEVLHILSVCL